MHSTLPGRDIASQPPRKTQGRERAKKLILFAVLAAVILLVGALLRPVSMKQATEVRKDVSMSQARIDQLMRMASNSAVSAFSDQFSSAAEIVSPYLWSRDSAANTLVSWNGEMLIAASTGDVARPAASATGDAGQTIALQPVLNTPAFPIAVFATRGQKTAHVATSPYAAAGTWVILAARGAAGKLTYAPGTFTGVTTGSCFGDQLELLRTTIPLAYADAGAALFDLNGALLGIAIECRDSVAILSSGEISDMLAAADSAAGRLRANFGIAVSAVSPALSVKNGTGVFVTDIWDHTPAGASALAPGDMILKVNDQEVDTPDELLHALTGQLAPKLSVLRGRKRMTITLEDATESAGGPASLGFTAATQDAEVLTEVAPGTALYNAGIRRGDLLINVDGTPPSRILLDKLDSAHAHVLVVRTGNRQKAVVVQP